MTFFLKSKLMVPVRAVTLPFALPLILFAVIFTDSFPDAQQESYWHVVGKYVMGTA